MKLLIPAVIPGLEGYPGCKGGAGVYQQIISHIPKTNLLYVPFLGHCAITRNIKRPRIMILNDLDLGVINKWRTALFDAGFKPRIIQKRIDSFSRDLIQCFEDEGSLIYLLSGDARSQIYLELPEDSTGMANTTIYADPPYPIAERRKTTKIYKHESTAQLHSDIISSYSKVSARVILSSYKNDRYDKALTGWNQHSFSAMTHGGPATETIYYNFDREKVQLQDYRYLGSDYKDRERIKLKVARHTNRLKSLPIQERNAILDSLNALKK